MKMLPRISEENLFSLSGAYTLPTRVSLEGMYTKRSVRSSSERYLRRRYTAVTFGFNPIPLNIARLKVQKSTQFLKEWARADRYCLVRRDRKLLVICHQGPLGVMWENVYEPSRKTVAREGVPGCAYLKDLPKDLQVIIASDYRASVLDKLRRPLSRNRAA